MADLGKKISELQETTDLAGLYTIGTDKNQQSKKVSLQFLKEAADFANAQGDYAKEVGDTVAGNVGVNAYPTFSASTQYAAGSVVNYNGKLYRFTSLHPAGAWVGTDAVLTSIKAEADLKLTELESKFQGKELIPDAIATANSYISPSGSVSASSLGLNIYEPFELAKGQKITIELSVTYHNVAVISKYSNGTYIPLVINANGDTIATYTASEDILVVVCKKSDEAAYIYNPQINTSNVFSEKAILEQRTLDGILNNIVSGKKILDLTLAAANKYIAPSGNVSASSSGLNIYEPFELGKGQSIVLELDATYHNVAVISKYSNGTYIPLVINEPSINEVTYTASEDILIAICKKSDERVIIPNSAISANLVVFDNHINLEEKLSEYPTIEELREGKELIHNAIALSNSYIKPNGDISTSSMGLNVYEPFELKKEQKVIIELDTSYYNIAVISRYDNGLYIPLVINTDGATIAEYTASEDILIAICKKSEEVAYIPTDIVRAKSTSVDVPINDLSNVEDILQYFNTAIKGVPQVSQLRVGNPIYISSDTGNEVIDGRMTVDIYAIYDDLCEAYPHLIKRESDIGVNSSNQEIRHYTICLQDAVLNQNETGVTPNMWTSENDMKHIVINAGWHGNEKSSVYGVALLVKELVESNSEWAVFVKSNVKIDVIPIANPWGFDYNQRNNKENVNCGFDFVNFTTSEARAVRDFILSIKDNTIAVIDSHNNPSDGCKSCFWEQRPTDFSFLAQTRLSAQIATIVRDSWKELLPSDRKPYLHMVSGEWDVSYTTFSWWFVQQGLWGITIESPCNKNGGAINNSEVSKLTKDMIANMLVAYINL